MRFNTMFRDLSFTVSRKIFLLGSLSLAVSVGADPKKDLIQMRGRPTIEDFQKAYPSLPAKNPFRSDNQYNEIANTWKSHGPDVIARFERAYPGAVWAFLGRDAALMGDLVDAYFRSIGNEGRVVRLNASGDGIRGQPQKLLVNFMQSAGLDLKNIKNSSPFILADVTSYGSTSQMRYLLKAAYDEYEALGGKRVDLIEKVNGVSLGGTGQHGGYSGSLEAGRVDRKKYFDGIKRNFTGYPDQIIGVNQPGFAYSSVWHDTFQIPKRHQSGKVEGAPGAISDVGVREQILHDMYEIVKLSSSPEFQAEVEKAANIYGVDILSSAGKGLSAADLKKKGGVQAAIKANPDRPLTVLHAIAKAGVADEASHKLALKVLAKDPAVVTRYMAPVMAAMSPVDRKKFAQDLVPTLVANFKATHDPDVGRMARTIIGPSAMTNELKPALAQYIKKPAVPVDGFFIDALEATSLTEAERSSASKRIVETAFTPGSDGHRAAATWLDNIKQPTPQLRDLVTASMVETFNENPKNLSLKKLVANPQWVKDSKDFAKILGKVGRKHSSNASEHFLDLLELRKTRPDLFDFDVYRELFEFQADTSKLSVELWDDIGKQLVQNKNHSGFQDMARAYLTDPNWTIEGKDWGEIFDLVKPTVQDVLVRDLDKLPVAYERKIWESVKQGVVPPSLKHVMVFSPQEKVIGKILKTAPPNVDLEAIGKLLSPDAKYEFNIDEMHKHIRKGDHKRFQQILIAHVRKYPGIATGSNRFVDVLVETTNGSIDEIMELGQRLGGDSFMELTQSRGFERIFSRPDKRVELQNFLAKWMTTPKRREMMKDVFRYSNWRDSYDTALAKQQTAKPGRSKPSHPDDIALDQARTAVAQLETKLKPYDSSVGRSNGLSPSGHTLKTWLDKQPDRVNASVALLEKLPEWKKGGFIGRRDMNRLTAYAVGTNKIDKHFLQQLASASQVEPALIPMLENQANFFATDSKNYGGGPAPANYGEIIKVFSNTKSCNDLYAALKKR